MPTPAFTAFNSGELSPLMEGRIDFAKYGSGCQELVNFVPTVQGPIRRRQGTRFVSEVKNSAARTWLARFEFSVDQAFILEFGNLYVRFYTNHGQVMSGMTPYEIASPYASANLRNSDGTFALSMVQSGDVIYIAHPNFRPYKLSRFGNTNWTLTAVNVEGGPFDDVNKDEAKTVYASAATGSVTLTASSSIFTAADVGSLFYIEQQTATGIPAWEVNRQFPQNFECISDGKFYRAVSTFINPPATRQYTGSVRPTHTEGRAIDGARNNDLVQAETSPQTIGVEWEYMHSGYGWARITGFTSGTVVTATVLSRLPDNVVGSTNVTDKWAYGDWSDRFGYPSHVTFFRERLTFAGRQKLWFSVVGDYENFTPRQSNVTLDDDSINVRISSDQVNQITWIVSGDALLIGTGGGEFACSENSSSDPFATRNVKITQQGRYGGRSVPPQVVSGATLFVQASGRKLRQLAYSFDRDSYSSTDLTVLSEHITSSGIIQMAYHQEPDTVNWCILSDGSLVGFTYNIEQDVTAWHRHAISSDHPGASLVESIQVIPTPDGGSQELWMIVRRTINGVTKRYVEYMTQNWRASDTPVLAVFVDSSVQYANFTVPITVMTGLGHLEGETVRILANGSTHPDRVVVGGQITLDAPSLFVQVGLPYTSRMTTMRIEAMINKSIGQAQPKKFSKAYIRFVETVGGFYGLSGGKMDEIQFRSSADPMSSWVPPFSGDKEVQWPTGWERDGRLTIEQRQALPMTLVGIYPELKVSG